MVENPLVVILAVGYDETDERREYKAAAMGSILKYYRQLGIRAKVLEKNHPDAINTSPSMARLLVFDLFPEESFILVQGLDVLPCNYKYDIRDFLEHDYINMAVDCSRIGQWPRECDFPHFKYNADLVGYPVRYKQFMRDVFTASLEDKKKYSCFEQYYLNAMIWEQGVYVHDLPVIFNRYYGPGFDYEHTAFCHYTNHMASRDKWKYIQEFHPKEML